MQYNLDANTVRRLLENLKTCPAEEIHTHLSPALRAFRLLSNTERDDIVKPLQAWAREMPSDRRLVGCYADLLQCVHQFIGEEFQLALPVLIATRHHFEEQGDKAGGALCAMLIGAVYRTFGNFELALAPLWDAQRVLTVLDQYPVFLAATANTLANVSLELHDDANALTMFIVAREESARAHDFYFLVYALHGLAKLYLRQGKPNEAIAACEHALAVARENQHALQTANSLSELADMRFSLNELAVAEQLHEAALTMRETHHFGAGAVTSCVRLGEIRIRQSRWEEAETVLQRGLAIAERLAITPKMARVHELLSALYEQRHDLERGLSHFRRFHELHAQQESERRTRELANAKVVFEAEHIRKENAIIRRQREEIHHKNRELEEKIDALTMATISRKARAFTFGLGVVIFIFQDAILGRALGALNSQDYLLSLAVKMGIIFSLAPINRVLSAYLLRRVVVRRRYTEEFATMSAQMERANT